MQPCSQPRYGLIERSNGMSGDVLRVMTLRAVSIATSVLNGGSSSIDRQPSSNATRTRGSNLPEAFVRAPRPRRRAESTSVLAAKSGWGSAPTSHILPAGPKCDGSGSGGRRRTAVCRDIIICSAVFRTKQEQFLHPRLAPRLGTYPHAAFHVGTPNFPASTGRLGMLQRRPCLPPPGRIGWGIRDWAPGRIHKSTSMLSVIIPTFNSERMLVPTLAMLISGATSGVVREVTVADRGSTDATLQVADAAGCEVAVSSAPLGCRLNAAAAAARSPWLMFLRAGTVLDATWLEET